MAKDLDPLHPRDRYNEEWEGNVRPPHWVNPTPEGRYNLVVIGAGTAGLVSAAVAAGLGAKVALLERGLMGGDCLNVGCVPSKGIISAAKIAAAVRRAGEFGVRTPGGMTVDFSAAMERMRRLRAKISAHDAAKRFRELGIDLYLGKGRFTGPDKVEVDGKKLLFKRAVIAVGARPSAPPIPGLEEVEYLTNETVFSLTELPPRMAVIGAGAIGCELAQAFAQFGSEVFLLESLHGVLPKEDPDGAAIIREALERDGATVLCCGRDLGIACASDGKIRFTVQSHEKQYDEIVDRMLLAVGRTPNVEGLGLEEAGVEYTKVGVKVNDRLQTTNPRIYAAGDIATPFQFTHAADFMARLVIQNALFKGRSKMSALTIPWCTFTTPEIAHVGIYENEAKGRGIEIDTYLQSFEEVDRAILEGEGKGFVKVHAKKETDRILGATIVAANAGDLIGEISLAMKNGLGLKAIGGAIHPYPTRAEAIRQLGDQYNRRRFTPLLKSLFQKWFKWTR